MRIISRPLAADVAGRRWLTIRCRCGAVFTRCDSNSRAACVLCKLNRGVGELLAEWEESEQARREAPPERHPLARLLDEIAAARGPE